MSKSASTEGLTITPLLYSASVVLLPLAFMLFITSANQELFQFLNGRLVIWQGAQFWAMLTNLGDGFFLYPLAMLLFRHAPRQQLAVILSIVLLALITNVAKNLIGLPRPGMIFDTSLISVIGPLVKTKSFPSGHAGTAFLLLGLGLIYLDRRLKILLALLMSSVALSRIAVGAHWPCDVIAGAWVGLTCAALGSWLSQKFRAGFKTRLLHIGLGVLAMLVLPGYDNGFQHYPLVCFMQYALAALTGVLVLLELQWLYQDYGRNFLPFGKSILPERFSWIAGKLMRFGAVGASGFVVDMTVYSLLFTLTGVPHLLSRGCSYWCAASWNWYWNRAVTFDDAAYARKFPQWGKYLLMCSISFIPNWGTYYLLTTHIDLFASYKQLALVAGVAAGMGFNFTIASMVIFQSGQSEKGDA